MNEARDRLEKELKDDCALLFYTEVTKANRAERDRLLNKYGIVNIVDSNTVLTGGGFSDQKEVTPVGRVTVFFGNSTNFSFQKSDSGEEFWRFMASHLCPVLADMWDIERKIKKKDLIKFLDDCHCLLTSNPSEKYKRQCLREQYGIHWVRNVFVTKANPDNTISFSDDSMIEFIMKNRTWFELPGNTDALDDLVLCRKTLVEKLKPELIPHFNKFKLRNRKTI